MFQIVVAIVFAISAVPAFLIVNEVGFAWESPQAWLRLGEIMVSNPDAIPQQLAVSLVWALLAVPTSIIMALRGVLRLGAEARGIQQTDAIKARKKKRREKSRQVRQTRRSNREATRAKSGGSGARKRQKNKSATVGEKDKAEDDDGASPDEGLNEESAAGEVQIIQDASEIDGSAPDPASQAASGKSRVKASGALSGARKKVQGAAQKRAAAKSVRKKGASKPTQRPVLMSELFERAREVARDTQVMVQDMIEPEEDDDDERPSRPSRIKPDRPGLMQMIRARAGRDTAGTEQDGGEKISSAWESAENDEPAQNDAGKQDQTRQKITDILAFYAMWTSAGPQGRTHKMRQQAKRLAEDIDEDLSNAIVQEHGMRGFSALNTLKSAAGVSEGANQSMSNGPAEPMPKPSDEELKEEGMKFEDGGDDGAETDSDGDDEGGDDLRAFPGSFGEKNPDAGDDDIPGNLKLSERELRDGFDDEPSVNGADAYAAEDGYEARDDAGSDRSETGVVGDNMLLEFGDEGGEDDATGGAPDDAAEQQIESAARAMTRPESEASTDDDMPEEAYQNDEQQGDQENGGETSEPGLEGNEDQEGDPYDEFSGRIHVIDDMKDYNGEGREPSEGEEDTYAERAPAWREDGREPAPSRVDKGENESRETRENRRQPTPYPADAEGVALDAFGQALKAQVEEIVDYQAKAYAWEQLGEDPPEAFDTEEKRKTYLRQLATSIVTLRDKMAPEQITALREALAQEQLRWLDERADKVMATLVNGGTSTDVHDQMTDEPGQAAPEWVELRYNEFWSLISPHTKSYRRLAEASQMKFFKSVQVNPRPQDEEAEEHYDEIEVLVADPRKADGSGGFKPGIMGVAFAVVPKGNWDIQKMDEEGDYPDRWALVHTDKHGEKRVRLRDRSIEIFKAWARERGRRPLGIVHIVLQDGAEVMGETDPDKVAEAVSARMAEDIDGRVTGRVFDDKTWSDEIVKQVMGT